MKKQMILLGMLMAFCMAEAKVTLPALFTDNMVLQQKSNVIFHGHSSTKKEVIIKRDGISIPIRHHLTKKEIGK